MNKTAVMILFVTIITCSASAIPVPTVRIEWDGGYDEITYDESMVNQNGDDTYELPKQLYDSAMCEADWALTYESDPSLTAVIGFANPTGMTQTYTLIFSIPVSPQILSNATHGGSTGGTMTDDGTLPGTVATVGASPFYSGEIDGTGVLSLHAAGSWSASFGGETISIPPVNAGLPGATLPSGVPVLSTIGIRHTFSLTPGDVIGVTSYFEVVPEPATLCLFGLGTLVLLRKRRV
jgi:hypothetical protein